MGTLPAEEVERNATTSTFLVALPLLLILATLACGALSEAEKRYNAGVELQGQGRLEEAIAEYDEATRLDPQLAAAYVNRGSAYGDWGQPQRAIEDYDEAIRLNPQDADYYNNRCVAYWRLGEFQRAVQDCDEAIRLNPQDASAHALRAMAHTSLGNDADGPLDCTRRMRSGQPPTAFPPRCVPRRVRALYARYSRNSRHPDIIAYVVTPDAGRREPQPRSLQEWGRMLANPARCWYV